MPIMRRTIQRVCCIGAGYVGGPTSAVIAAKNPNIEVTVVDSNLERIEAWKSDQLPIFEPGLLDIIRIARDGSEDRAPNLFFSTDVDTVISQADLVFVCVNTPTKATGVGAGRATELAYLESAVRRIAEAARADTIIVEKSTVPCRTAETIMEILEANGKPGVHFEVLSNPEFLAEGTAITNLLLPDRILIGSLQTESGLHAASALAELYGAWVQHERIIMMNIWSCELSKMAANALLAQRISSINALSAICEATGADIEEVAYACGLDTRIGPRMLQASVGFGGSCFKKDILSLAYTAEMLHLNQVADYWTSVVAMNEYQKDRFTKRIISCLHHSLTGKKLAVLGFAYKKDTGDTRESAAIEVVSSLLAEGANVSIYDPGVKEEHIWRTFAESGKDTDAMRKNVSVASTAYEACEDAYTVIILTEWTEFSNRSSTSSRHKARPYLDSFITTNGHVNGTTNGTTINGHHSTKGVNGLTAINDTSSSPPTALAVKEVDHCSQRLDWARVAKSMKRPMFVFDGRNVVDAPKLAKLGFHVERIGSGDSDRIYTRGSPTRGSPTTSYASWNGL